MNSSQLSAKTAIRAPFAEEKKRFYEVYKTGLPNVDEIPFDRFSKWWDTSTGNGELERLWRVAVRNERILGIAINVVNEPLKWGMVWELAVLPEYRDKGIGSRLVRESERLLVKHERLLTHFAIGVKTHNTRALSLYERLGYGVQFLVLRLKGNIWERKSGTSLVIHDAQPKQVDKLLRLIPDAYWSYRSRDGWRKRISEGECHVLTKPESSEIVGVVNFSGGKTKGSSTELAFSIKPGFGIAVLDAVLKLVKTRQIDLWVQDSHQDILEHLYLKGLKRIDSEYLLTKSVGKAVGR